jgi:hypothetical protein
MADVPTKKAAVALDAWKLPIFERHLRTAGYAWEHAGALTDDALVLTVQTTNMQALAQVVLKANQEAARTGKPTR